MVGQEDFGVDAAQEVTGKFFSCFEFLILEHVREIPVFKITKERVDQALPDERLELVEELRFLYLVVVVVIALIGVFLNTVTQNLTEVLTSRFLDLPQPLLGIIHAIINDILEGALGAN